MATPKGPPGVSTPKNLYASTPNRLNASPRPHSGAVGSKTLSYKSPAVKTPSSVPNHAHRVSISSHPTSTPLAAPAIHEELLNLNSPAAALIASIGNVGLTPIATSQDGLGITTGITPHSARDGLLPPKNPEIEKINRLEQVAKLLKTRIEGRGVTRDGVERIAHIHGFTILWDEENLTIAGNSVDLEIIFDALERNVVRDVQLRLNISGSDEPQLQKEASAILKDHLTENSVTGAASEAWQSLRQFSIDLQYLSQLDYINSSANGFELVHNLYTTFRRIWDEEQKRLRDRTESSHTCLGNVGRPCLDTNGRLGVTSQFWLDKHNYAVVSEGSEIPPANRDDVWTTRFTCKKGGPGIRNNYDWLDSEPLRSAVTTEDVFEDTAIQKPNWSNSSLAKTMSEQQKDNDVAMMLEEPVQGNVDTLDLVFICQLDIGVPVPVNVLGSLNAEYPMIDLNLVKPLTYQQVLLKNAKDATHKEPNISGRWAKSLPFLEGQNKTVQAHSYSLHTNGVWIHPVIELQFSHPKHYADAVPILRQYALLWSILRNTLGDVSNFGTEANQHAAKSQVVQQRSRKEPIKRNNRKKAQDQLENIIHSSQNNEESLRKIDLSIDLLTDASKAKLNVVAPISNDKQTGPGGSDFMHITVEIRRDGMLDIPVLRGSSVLEEDKLRQRAIKVLGLSEDLSVLVEWLFHRFESSS